MEALASVGLLITGAVVGYVLHVAKVKYIDRPNAMAIHREQTRESDRRAALRELAAALAPPMEKVEDVSIGYQVGAASMKPESWWPPIEADLMKIDDRWDREGSYVIESGDRTVGNARITLMAHSLFISRYKVDDAIRDKVDIAEAVEDLKKVAREFHDAAMKRATAY